MICAAQGYLHPQMLQSTYASLRRPLNLGPNRPPLSMEAAEDLYADGLSAAASTDRHNVGAPTHHARDLVFKELQDFLALLPAPFQRTVYDCLPQDLLVFMETYWLPQHVGSQTSSGVQMAAPSSVDAAISHLSSCFQLLGRVAWWDFQGPEGSTIESRNPARSNALKKWLLGYTKRAAGDGFSSTGAKELSTTKVLALLQHLQRQLLEPNPMQRHLAARDGFAFSFLWETGARGVTAGVLKTPDILLPTGQPALPLIWPTLQLPSGSQVLIIPKQLKTCIGRNTQALHVTVQPGDASATCPIYWLRQCLTTAAACNFPITPGSPIVRTLMKGSLAVSDKPASTGTLGKRLSQHLSLLQCHEGESMHSFRRGRAITDTAAGLSNDAIMSKLLLKTPGVLKTKYQAVGRHASRVTRLKSSVPHVATAGSMSSQPSSMAAPAHPKGPLHSDQSPVF